MQQVNIFIEIYDLFLFLIKSVSIVTTETTDTTERTVAGNALPSECSSYSLIRDDTRNAGYSILNCQCDQSGVIASAGQYRFCGAAGTMLANFVLPINQYNTQATGWYNWASNACMWSNPISVTNCNGYYVFYISPPPVCNLRYYTI